MSLVDDQVQQAPPGAQPRPGLVTRAYQLALNTFNEAKRTVQAVLATENPVLVFDWTVGQPIDEILLMSGLEPVEQVPLLDTHNRFTVAAQLGSTRNIHIVGSELRGTRHFADTDEGRRAASLVRDGHLTDGSIGVLPVETVMIRRGKTAQVSGRTFRADPRRDLRIVLKWQLREDSMCPIGADPDAKVRAEQKGKIIMFPNSTETPPAPPAPQAPSVEHHAAPQPQPMNDLDAERQRVATIRSLAGPDVASDIIERAISEGHTVDQASEACLKAIREARPKIGDAVCITGGIDRGAASFAPAIADALLLRCQMPLIEETPGGRPVLDDRGRPKTRQPHDRALQFRDMPLMEMARAFLSQAGERTEDLSRREIVHRALTTRAMFGGFMVSGGSLADILGDTVGKSLRGAYAVAHVAWPKFARRRTHRDYRTISRVKLSEIEDLEEVTPGGEYSYSTLQDSKETYALAKYGKLVALTFEDIINDDLGAFRDIPTKLAEAARRKEDELVVNVLTANAAMADGVVIFHADHGNLAAGGDVGAPSVTSLNEGRRAMRVQMDIAGLTYLNIEPAAILGPAALEGTIDELILSPVKPEATHHEKNIWEGKLEKCVHPRFDANSTTKWYLSAGPAQSGVEVCFLAGQETPAIERETAFERDVIGWKVRHTIAAAVVDHRPLYCNPGA